MRQGLTLVELILVTLIGTIIVLLALSIFRVINRQLTAATAQATLLEQSSGMASQILQMGRMAQNCSKMSATELECDLNLNSPPTSGTNTKRRIKLNSANQTLNYEEQVGSNWRVLKTYPDIEAFLVCDDTDMSTSSGCSLLPAGLSDWHEASLRAAAAIATGPNRYFRFQITQITRQADTATGRASIKFQSAFYVRNPISVPGGTLIYQWGSRK